MNIESVIKGSVHSTVKLPAELKGLLLVHRLPTFGNLEAFLKTQRKDVSR